MKINEGNYETVKDALEDFLNNEIASLIAQLGGRTKAAALLGHHENYFRLMYSRKVSIEKLEKVYSELKSLK